MTFHPAAFRVGEFVKLASAETIRLLQIWYSDNEILYCEPSMDQYADRRVRVVQNAWPIPGVAYRLEEIISEERRITPIPGIWTEGAIVCPGFKVDPKLLVGIEQYCQRASEIYTATADNVDGAGLVYIHDGDRRLVFCFRDQYAKFAADDVNRIARLRCRIAFEQYFGFDGHYPERLDCVTECMIT
ncbi:MAG: hypothetical protein MUC83_01075 [Pirellula sp.]|jgi:hypothetical protein|nr:hypothetical protein [Pirellula sp.]